MAKDTGEFFRCEIEGMIFKATMSVDGPYIQRQIFPGYWKGVALGRASIRFFDENTKRMFNEEAGWWVIKYSNECRIPLNGLSGAGRMELSRAFGLPMFGYRAQNEVVSFAKSAAFQGLCDWARKHPRLAKQNRTCQEYIPWVGMVDVVNQRTSTA